MAGKPGFLQYLTAAFNARPFGMVVAPNWVGLAAAGLLGLANPGFWVLGAGLELGYLLVLATNERFRRIVAARQIVHAPQAKTGRRASAARFSRSANAVGFATRRSPNDAGRSSTCR